MLEIFKSSTYSDQYGYLENRIDTILSEEDLIQLKNVKSDRLNDILGSLMVVINKERIFIIHLVNAVI